MKFTGSTSAGLLLFLAGTLAGSAAAEPLEISGIFPSLAMFNNEGECGTGAVVPWAGRLWVITYAPHKPQGSSDKLYEITPDLRQIVRPESIGGTPANRMIHPESQQLFIGPYAIDATGGVRVIRYDRMPGRPTGNARHLSDPARKLYCATMEEGLYEIDVATLAVRTLYADNQRQIAGRPVEPAAGSPPLADLPGYHGKGLYSGQGRVIYANNGEPGEAAKLRPDVPSGCLAEWNGTNWTVVRRNQFTEVTGPGGITGNPRAATDPVWSIGWDHRSLLLMVRHQGRWETFRLPKPSHSYDGAHGWNTEWPRIRDIGEADLMMTMHGAFWKFPRDFAPGRTAGLAPRSGYLKVVGDFCRWQDWVVLGCDDTAQSEFLNRRRAKGDLAPPQSQSNLWFVRPERLDAFGPVLGRGAVWLDEDVPAGQTSEPFLIGGFDRRGLHLSHRGGNTIEVRLEIDAKGDGNWRSAGVVTVPARGYVWTELAQPGTWLRLTGVQPMTGVTAAIHEFNEDRRPPGPDSRFDGLGRIGEGGISGGLLRSRGENRRTLSLAAIEETPGGPVNGGYYELDANLELRPVKDAATEDFTRTRTRIPAGVLQSDAASVLYVDDAGRRWRLPKGDPAFDRPGRLGPSRVAREVATERDLFNAHGTFYELPAENAGGFAKVRPVSTHNCAVQDFCSYRGLLVLTGVSTRNHGNQQHHRRSTDNRAAVWVGTVDDLWALGKPRGRGGPWLDTPVQAGRPSDPYLMTGYDRKRVELRHDGAAPVTMALEVDLTGDGHWVTYREFPVGAGQAVTHKFPAAFSACWVRARASADCRATVQLAYD